MLRILSNFGMDPDPFHSGTDPNPRIRIHLSLNNDINLNCTYWFSMISSYFCYNLFNLVQIIFVCIDANSERIRILESWEKVGT